MCRVEYYGVLYPDGFVERKQRIVHCRRGTRSSQCSNLEYDQDSYEERPATEDEIRARTEPWLHVIAPRPESSGRSEITSEASKPKGSKLRRFFGAKMKPKYVSTQEKPRDNRLTRLRPQEKPPQQRRSSPRDPPGKSRTHESDNSRTSPRDTQRRQRQEVKVHNPAKEKGTGSSSPKRDYQSRHQYSSSTDRDTELDRARLREEERQKHKDKVAKEQAEAEAEAQAKKLHEELVEEQHQQDIAWARKEGKKKRDGSPRSYHAVPDEPMTDEQLRAQQLQRERDLERLREFDRRVAEWQAEEEYQTQLETDEREARRRQDEERHAWRQQEDQARRRRRREAGIPRQPHHTSIVHDIRNYDPDDFDQQGTDFIESATRAAERRQAERRAPPASWRLPVRGRDGLVRRNTIDGTQREERNGRRRRDYERSGRSD